MRTTKGQMVRTLGSKASVRVVVYLLVLVVSVWSLIPLLWGLSTSLKQSAEVFTSPPRWIPAKPTLSHYSRAFFGGFLWKAIFSSLVVSSMATIISLVLGAVAAYPLARLRFPGSSLVLVVILSSMMIPGVCNLIPLYVMLSKFSLLSSYAGIIVIYGGWGIPYAVWIMRGFFQGLPGDLEDAARVDGCNRLQTLWRIICPVSAPAIISTTIFLFLRNWNEYIAARTYLQAGDKWTIPVMIVEKLSSWRNDWGGLNAISVISYLPVLILFSFLSKYFISGLLSGSSR